MGEDVCGVCQAAAKQACGGCGTVFYCGKEHQRNHWATHRQECQPYQVVSSPEAGQYLVAGRDLKAGQRVLRDTPLVVGPLSSSMPLCLGCNAMIDNEDFVKCPQCHWPVCSLECATSSTHKDECLILAEDVKRIAPPQQIEDTSRYDIIMILRCLLLRSTDPSAWMTMISMASHIEERMEALNQVHKTTVGYLTEVLQVDYDTDIVNQVRGAVATNALEIRSDKGTTVRAVYPRIRLLNHACVPNTHLTSSSHGVMEVRTAVPLERGAAFHICYTGTIMPLWERQILLRDSYYFHCSCFLCDDPSELGTYFSSSRCPECKDIFLQPSNKLGKVHWQCQRCQYEESISDVQERVDGWLDNLETKSLFQGSSVEQVIATLGEAEQTFHSCHYIWMKVAQSALCAMRNNRPTLTLLKLRQDIWTRLLSIYETFEPGLTRRRGMSLLETANALYDTSLLEYKINETHCTAQVQTAVRYLEEAAHILGLEPPDSKEAFLAKRAQDQKTEAEGLLALMGSAGLRPEVMPIIKGTMGVLQVCEVCGAREANLACSECEQAHYCSSSHQDAHLEQHKITCHPSVIELKDPGRGRYLVAANDVKAGELLFREEPIALGPRAFSYPLCLGCHKLIEDYGFPRCPKCLWPLCSPSCASSELHKAECPVLAKDTSKIGQPIDMSQTPRYDCIFVLRCLLLRETNPKAWRRLLSMASHAVQLVNDEEPHHMATTRYIKEVLKAKFDIKLIHHARGAIMANCFEWHNPSEVSLRGMYPKLARINHSCYPNVTISSDCDGLMYVRAAIDLKARCPLSIAYTGITEPTWERQAYTDEIHYFSCECQRCSDPTELGLYYSSPKCEKCKDKFLMPMTWLGETIWECTMCNNAIPDYLVKTEYIQWMSRFDCNDTFITAQPRGVRKVLEKVEFAFHPKHHVWVMAAQVAIRTLEKNDTRDSLLLRRDLWKRLLEIYSVLEPGLTRRRGMTLYELGMCESSLTRLDMREGRLTDHFYNLYMREALELLQEAISVLRLEPPRSHQQRWYKKAIEEAEMIALDIKSDAKQDNISPMIILKSANPFGNIHLEIRNK